MCVILCPFFLVYELLTHYTEFGYCQNTVFIILMIVSFIFIFKNVFSYCMQKFNPNSDII